MNWIQIIYHNCNLMYPYMCMRFTYHIIMDTTNITNHESIHLYNDKNKQQQKKSITIHMPKLQEVVQWLWTVISGLDFGLNFFSHSAYLWCKRPGRKRFPIRPRVFEWWGFEFFTHRKWKVVSERAIFRVPRRSVTWLKTGGWGSVSHPGACRSQWWQSISVTWSADPLSPRCWWIKIIQSNHIYKRTKKLIFFNLNSLNNLKITKSRDTYTKYN